jgi:hypothetical protein
MSEMYFEDHPTDPNKVILRKKPHLDKGRDYEEGFIDGMQHQMQSSVDRAVNAMAKREWVGLTDDERRQVCIDTFSYDPYVVAEAIEAKLKEKNT